MFARYRFARSLLLAALLTSSAATAKADPEMYQHVLRSTAFIVGPNSVGSGALIDLENRLVITAYHVVDDTKEVLVFFAGYDEDGELITDDEAYGKNLDKLRSNGLAQTGRVVAISPDKDVALIQLEDLPLDAQALPLATASPLRGENVHIVGNSGVSDGDDSNLWRYTRGNVRNIYVGSMQLGAKNRLRDAYILETDSPVNGGDSGGPVVNDNGELVGVVSAYERGVASPGGGFLATNLVSYAVEVQEVYALLDRFYGDAPAR